MPRHRAAAAAAARAADGARCLELLIHPRGSVTAGRLGALPQEVMESYEVELDGKTYQVGVRLYARVWYRMAGVPGRQPCPAAHLAAACRGAPCASLPPRAPPTRAPRRSSRSAT